MFTVTINNLKFKVRFHHFSNGKKGHKNRFITNCFVLVYDKDATIDDAPVSFHEGQSICHPNDTINKSTGKRIALHNAIKLLDRETRLEIFKGL